MKKLILVVVLLVLAAAAAWLARARIQTATAGSAAAGRGGPPAVAVETKPVRRGEIRDVGVFTGSLLPKSQFLVASKVTGWLRELKVHVGDSVERNQLVAVLDDAEFAQQVSQAQAELQVAKANAENCTSELDIARREYERVTALREKQIASASELDQAASAYNACQSQLKVAQAQVEQKEAALKAAQLRLSYAQVQAFWEGADQTRVIGERFVDEGALVQVNQPIVSVLQNDPVTAVVHVIEQDYSKVKAGQESFVSTDAYPTMTFTGSIVRIAPLLKESSRQGRVEIEIPNPGQVLKPGMFVRARVEFARRQQANLVPLAALVRRDGRHGVFLADPDARQARFVAVTRGIVEGETVEIAEPELSGLVVTLGNHLLEDGAPILIAPAEPAAAASSPAGR